MSEKKPGQAGKLDPDGPNKFEPKKREPFPTQPKSPHEGHGHKGKSQSKPKPKPPASSDD